MSRCGTCTILSSIQRNGAPSVAACGVRGAQCAGDELQIRIGRSDFAQHLFVTGDWAVLQNPQLTPLILTPSMAVKSSSFPSSKSTLRTSSRFTSCALAFPPIDFQSESRIVQVIGNRSAVTPRRIHRLTRGQSPLIPKAQQRCRRCGTSAHPSSSPKIDSQSKSPALTWLMAVWPRSEHPAAARIPNPRSVKLRPLRTVRPTPSKATHLSSEVSTPPCRMQSSTSRPTGLSANAVAIAVRSPKHRRRPARHVVLAAALPDLKCRVVCVRPSPGSRRSITSPKLRQSQRRAPSGITIEFINVDESSQSHFIAYRRHSRSRSVAWYRRAGREPPLRSDRVLGADGEGQTTLP